MTGGRGRIHRINVSRGGVPKLPVPEAHVLVEGLAEDAQADLRYHGGERRAVSLFSREVIERLVAEGHPIAPGSAGENLTVEGLDWSILRPLSRLRFDEGVELEVTSYCSPCSKIAPFLRDGRFERLSQKLHPGESRVYARVLREGTLRVGDGITLV
jgi:MOSC domain-containing protein YiiM